MHERRIAKKVRKTRQAMRAQGRDSMVEQGEERTEPKRGLARPAKMPGPESGTTAARGGRSRGGSRSEAAKAGKAAPRRGGKAS